jgi:hypothetical protein
VVGNPRQSSKNGITTSNWAHLKHQCDLGNLGYAKVKGNWHKSYYRGTPGPDANYGMKGKTKVNGRYISAKVGINFNENYNLELEHAKHKIHADAFRSFNIRAKVAKMESQHPIGHT